MGRGVEERGLRKGGNCTRKAVGCPLWVEGMESLGKGRAGQGHVAPPFGGGVEVQSRACGKSCIVCVVFLGFAFCILEMSELYVPGIADGQSGHGLPLAGWGRDILGFES